MLHYFANLLRILDLFLYYAVYSSYSCLSIFFSLIKVFKFLFSILIYLSLLRWLFSKKLKCNGYGKFKSWPGPYLSVIFLFLSIPFSFLFILRLGLPLIWLIYIRYILTYFLRLNKIREVIYLNGVYPTPVKYNPRNSNVQICIDGYIISS